MELCRATVALQDQPPPCLQSRRRRGSSSIVVRRRQQRWPSFLRALTAVLVSVGTATGAAATAPRWGSPGFVDGSRGQRYLSRPRDEHQSTADMGASVHGRSGRRQFKGAMAAFVAVYGSAAAAATGVKNKSRGPNKARSSTPVGWGWGLGGRPTTRPETLAGGALVAPRALPTDGDAGVAGERRPPQRRRRTRGGEWKPSLYMSEGIFQALPFPVRITVMGGGNFGLALSLVLARNQIPTTLLVRTDSVAEYVNSHNEHPNYLKGIKLPRHIVATADPAAALKDATYIIHAVPVQYTRKFLENVKQHMPPGAPIMSVSKGIETSSLMLMNDILKEMCGSERSYAFLSGPSFAREIAMNQATAVVIASDDSCLANDMAKVLSSPTFRCFTSKDVIGVEVGGAVKNVIALAAGMCEGLGLGTNAMAGLVTRGCGEMRRMAVILGGKSRTLSGLSGVGDTFGTCFGPLSRNRNFGIRLGKGESMEEILASSTEVAEGVDTALALADLIKTIDKSYRIDLKYAIIFGVADILKGERSPKEGLEDLMTMPLRAEMYDSL